MIDLVEKLDRDVRSLVRGEEIQRPGLKSWWPAADGIDLGIGEDGRIEEDWVREFFSIPRVRKGSMEYRVYACRTNYGRSEVIFRLGDEHYEALLMNLGFLGYALVDRRRVIGVLSDSWLSKIAPGLANLTRRILIDEDRQLKARFPKEG